MKNKIFIFVVLILTAITFTLLHAQSKEKINEKLSKLKGEIEKIVISTDEGDVTFEGEEAKEIKDRLTNFYGEKDFILELKDDEGKYERIFIVNKEDSSSNFNWVTTGGHSIDSMITIDEIEGASQTIKIEIEDGSKTITVTKVDEEGNETTESYEGEEAEEYLKKMEDENKISVLQINELGGEKDKLRVIIEKLKKKEK